MCAHNSAQHICNSMAWYAMQPERGNFVQKFWALQSVQNYLQTLHDMGNEQWTLSESSSKGLIVENAKVKDTVEQWKYIELVFAHFFWQDN